MLLRHVSRCNKMLILSGIMFFLLVNCAAKYGCQTDPSLCSKNSVCIPRGICVCDAYYYGSSCQNSISESDRVSLISGGISESVLAGIIIVWIIGCPIIALLVII